MEELNNSEDWVRQFNHYQNNRIFAEAVQLIWDDWNNSSNPFFELLPNVDSLIFALVTHQANRATEPINEPLQIAGPPQAVAWNDAPIYDTISNAWNGLIEWSCATWKHWHVALETHFKDTKKANAIWEVAWQHPDNACAWGVCPDTQYCRYDCDFVEYFATKGIDIGNTVSKSLCDLSSVVLNIVSAADNLSEGIKDSTNTLKNIAPFATIGLVFWGGNQLYKGL